ncbi:MAG: M14 family metallocarboxypeptidase [Bdellovibrionales bacterium]|nr:M14 family metallocarboxypeptidase [Bdellovibrionales bacterium]
MKWGPAEKEQWLAEQTIKRSYRDEVVTKIKKLSDAFDVIQYGALSINPELYPVFLIKSKKFDKTKETILITGGVHGYETSGVHGALGFMETAATHFEKQFNFVCAPCISPWAYETINRWNPKAIDPNRSFREDSPAEECDLFLKAMKSVGVTPFAHFDLHETTDTDNSVFRPALEKRDGIPQELWDIPDGFYLVGDSEDPKPAFQKAIIDEVKKVTHIAPHDQEGRIIGVEIEQDGVINYELKKLYLCAGFSGAEYTTTTEVYPDSPKVNDQICIDAQIAAINGGLNYLRANFK